MLILSRKEEESIVIGDSIVIKVISLDKGSVKLGFEAPQNTLILRSELKDAVVAQNQRASGTSKENELLDIKQHIKG